MVNIAEQKVLYHLTSSSNLDSIFEKGLKSRAELGEFHDIADQEIILNRRGLSLEKYVPFHWFARNPFDGRVQADHPKELFVLITVQRSLAEHRDWNVIPCHPLASGSIELMNYKEGFASIDWAAMNRRDYHDPYSKSVCMAECLSPITVMPNDFYIIFVRCEKSAAYVKERKKHRGIQVEIKINPSMFSP
jgi:hypothetical protein